MPQPNMRKKSVPKETLLTKMLAVIFARLKLAKDTPKPIAKKTAKTKKAVGSVAAKIARYVISDTQHLQAELYKELHGKDLHADFYQQLTILKEQLDAYHENLKANLDKPAQIKSYWENLDNLGNQFGKCLLWLCDQEGKLKFDKSQRQKYEQIHPFITVVEKEFHKIANLKKELEKELNLLGKRRNPTQEQAYKRICSTAKSSNLSFDEVMQQIYFNKHENTVTKTKTRPSLK